MGNDLFSSSGREKIQTNLFYSSDIFTPWTSLFNQRLLLAMTLYMLEPARSLELIYWNNIAVI